VDTSHFLRDPGTDAFFFHFHISHTDGLSHIHIVHIIVVPNPFLRVARMDEEPKRKHPPSLFFPRAGGGPWEKNGEAS
jgi:hypothetical protein